jgi:YidC/Oxa1 family membrane protein insertase
MEKNLLLAVGLSVLVYAAWFGIVEKRYMPHPSINVVSADSPVQSSPSTSTNSNAVPVGIVALDTAQKTQKAYPLMPAVLGKASLQINPLGAGIVSWKYQEPLGMVELVLNSNPGFFSTFPGLRFRQDHNSKAMGFIAKRADGLIIQKEFLPGSNQNVPQLRLTLKNSSKKPIQTGAWAISVGPGLGTIESEKKENPKVWRAVGLRFGNHGLNGKLETFKAGDQTGLFQWVGIDNRYFLAALLPKAGDFSAISSLQPPEVILSAPNVILNPGGSHVWVTPFYVGEKGYTWLSRYHLGLERAVNFGFFAQIGHLVLKILVRLDGWTGNWGWSIILLTLFLQVLLFPLTLKSLKAQMAMRKLQPEITKLQKKYASEPSKLNAETMELYKKNGANPLGGCLPMVIQAPVFIALYTTLRNAWELHAAPWIFWIKDLSAKDPYYILPLVMGGLMFAQNKLNPPPGDPAQAQIMTWMPIVFTVMFLNFPAGLVLYWLTNSLASALIQLGLKKYYDRA